MHAEIQQYLKVNAVGNLGDLTKGNSDMFHALLAVKVCPSTFTEFKCLYKINFSEHGSNQKIQEDHVVYCFETFLQDIFEGTIKDLSLTTLLTFKTGAQKVQPLSFPDPISVDFYNFNAANRSIKRLQYSSTCSLI